MDDRSPLAADDDPTVSNPQFYTVLWENDDVRVLEYRDDPGQETTPHRHPNSVMVTLTSFRRRLLVEQRSRDVELSVGSAVWLPAQAHSGRNIGETPTHTILIELKHSRVSGAEPGALGPETE